MTQTTKSITYKGLLDLEFYITIDNSDEAFPFEYTLTGVYVNGVDIQEALPDNFIKELELEGLKLKQ